MPTTDRLPGAIRVLVVASFVVALGYGIVAPALPVFATGFGVGVAAASLVVSAFAVCRLVFAPVSGRLVGRIGELRVFCAGLAIVAASSAACAFAATYWQLLVLRSLGGIGSTMFTVSAAALLVRLSPPHLRGRAVGAWATGFLLGTIAGPLLGGALIGQSLRLPFLAYAVLLVVAAALSAVALRGRADGGPTPGRPAATFPAAFGHRTFRAALTANFVHGWTVYGVWVALVPLYVVDVLARPAAWSGAVLAVTAGGTAAALVVGARMADACGRRLPVLLGLGICAAGTLLPGLPASLPLFVLASLLVGVGNGLLDAPMNAAVADVVSDVRGSSGTALAGFQMVGDVGAVVGPVVAGLVADATGFGTAFALTALIAVAAFVHWLGAPETAPRRLRAQT
ncbi:MFS transporter [Pseudonocardia lacus]|uniref:MFS transporter n=1 Tax=Pseudonocardia lacus TaxID=2835865 RepID=UPI001BDD9DC1|nr:MFS transporter [Pseudonocardia lacus]